MSSQAINTGLDGVVAAATRLSDIDGTQGELTLAGYPVDDLAPNATFEEVVHLILFDQLPNERELADIRAKLAQRRHLPPATLNLLAAAARADVPPMDALRMAIAASHSGDSSKDNANRLQSDALAVIAQVPTAVAAFHRLRDGAEPLSPREDLGHTANYLYMLFGKEPGAANVRALETYLNTVVDHGLNASTFAARVIVATRSDIFSAVTGAIGALKGPLHGGAPGPALDMVFEIGTLDRAEPYIRELLARGERLMGFGHRVYKIRDPRADVLADAASRLYKSGEGDPELYRLAAEIEKIAVRLLEEHKPGRNLQTNVEYYTALLLHSLGFGVDLFTPTFAIGRVTGWAGHCLEQRELDRLIRPLSIYSGARGRQWQELSHRS